jgi:S-adenosylmethionine synthetase
MEEKELGGGAWKDPRWIVVPLMLHVILLKLSCHGVADEILVQVSYAIGFIKPMGIFIDTYGTSKLNLTNGELLKSRSYIFDMRPTLLNND